MGVVELGIAYAMLEISLTLPNLSTAAAPTP
jgi:hypothetical protein